MKSIKDLNEYFNLTKSIYKKSTNEMHQRFIDTLERCFKILKIKSLNSINFQSGFEIINWLKQNTFNKNNSINKIVRYLKRVMLHYGIKSNFYSFKNLKCDTVPFKRFFHEELKTIVQYVMHMNYTKNSIVYKTLVFLLLDSGIRLSEALGIKLSDIDFGNKTIIIASGKTSKIRYAPFSSFSSELIKNLIDVDKSREFLFYNFLKNRLMTRHDVKLFYRRLSEKTGIKKIHSHRFRKTFGSILAENGMPIQYIQALYDHSRLDTTMIYVNYKNNQAIKVYREYNQWFN